MKVDRRALAGIERKITRADQHFRFLNDEMRDWFGVGEPRPWELIPEVHEEGRKHFYRLHFLKPIPVDWAVILGEAIHDLRSALDQAVYWLTIDHLGRDPGGTGFPVNRKRADFNQWSRRAKDWAPGSGMYKIRGVGPGPQEFIEALQPYPQRRAQYCRDVRVLNDLWNQDKHRLVHLWGLRLGHERLKLPKHIAPHSTIYVERRILHERAIAMKVVCGTPEPEVKVIGEVVFDLAFFAGKRRGGGGNSSLWDLNARVADITRKLVGALGSQDRPINLMTWTLTNRGPQAP